MAGRRVSHVRKLLFGVLAALAVLALGAGPALADVDIFTKGTVGRHWLRDTPDKPGAKCTYTSGDAPWLLTTFKVRAPFVFAIDRNEKRNRELVGWRFLIDTYDPNNSSEGAHIFYRSPLQRAWAYDDMPAPFSAMSVTPDVPDNDYQYRLFVKMFWYRPDGSVRGSSVHVLTQYKHVYGASSYVGYGNCAGTLYET
jgi:hypothetical protein